MVVVNKGYTLTVVSWENDGDYYNTKSKTVDTKEEAEALYNLMLMCQSKNSRYPGDDSIVLLGNTCDGFSNRQKQAIIDFFKAHPILADEDVVDEDDYMDMFYDYSYSLLGGSEWYSCRVMEKCTVTYSSDTISVEEIKFN
jgi:hypothetical protein